MVNSPNLNKLRPNGRKKFTPEEIDFMMDCVCISLFEFTVKLNRKDLGDIERKQTEELKSKAKELTRRYYS